MALSLPRSRSVEAISYGYIGRCVSMLSSDSASRLLTLRRLAIRYHLVSESSLSRTRPQVLVSEYTHAGIGCVNPETGEIFSSERTVVPRCWISAWRLATRGLVGATDAGEVAP